MEQATLNALFKEHPGTSDWLTRFDFSNSILGNDDYFFAIN